jgi:hypothetical protein
MQVYLSRSLKSGSTQEDILEELTPTEFKVTLSHAGKIYAEEKSGNQDNLEELDSVILRKIKETCLEAKSKGMECIISIVRNEQLLFNQVTDIKVGAW